MTVLAQDLLLVHFGYVVAVGDEKGGCLEAQRLNTTAMSLGAGTQNA